MIGRERRSRSTVADAGMRVSAATSPTPRRPSGRPGSSWRRSPRTAPRATSLRDRDAVYGAVFSLRVHSLGIREVKTALGSPWQNPYVERLIGTRRRECLDRVVVLNATHLRRLLRDYVLYYHSARTHLSLDKDVPER
jgi:transposase InsO family protein